MTDNVKDVLFPSDNWLEIPVLKLEMQAEEVELPIVPYGTAYKMSSAKTIHYYVDDYRFECVWNNPAKGLNRNITQAVEPNISLFDTTPIARGLERIYRKRWIACWWQKQGVKIYADLNVSAKFYDYNQMGIPNGWNAFATRGYRNNIEALKAEHDIARKISGCNIPNLIVYGGGKEIAEYCSNNSLLYITDFMTEKGEWNNG
ncbi:MAG: DUF4417 domain-containing protein [Muribaculaceae bacterium]|nr:DUF4417 domain-containing protein [Muribaculaceae bacterium]